MSQSTISGIQERNGKRPWWWGKIRLDKDEEESKKK